MTLAAALLGWSFDGIEMGVFPLVARPALIELLGNVDEETIRRWNAVFAAAFLTGAAMGGIIFGWLGDRIGRVRALSITVLVYAGFTGVAALAQTASQLAALRFFAALGMGGEWALGVALVIETWPAQARPWLAGAIGAAVNVGYVAIAGLACQLPPNPHWRWLLGVCSLPALLAFFVRRYVPESAAWQQLKRATPSIGWRELFTTWHRQIFIGTAAGAVMMLAIWGGVQITQLWVGQMAGSTAAATVQLVSALSATVGAFLGPVLLAGRSRRLGWAVLTALALCTSEMFFLNVREYGTALLGCVALLGIATGAITGWMTLYLSELFPTPIRATGAGACYNAGRILAAAGVLLTAGPLDVRGNYPLACAIVSLVYVVGLAIAPVMIEPNAQAD